MKILYALSQRPEATGSGIYIRAMIKEAAKRGIGAFLFAGLRGNESAGFDKPGGSAYVRFNRDVSFDIPGMSDVMPYPSIRFSDLDAGRLEEYKRVFGNMLTAAVKRFKPDLIHSNHLWIMTSLITRLFPDIPVICSSHGSDIRQYLNRPHLRAYVRDGCSSLDGVIALNYGQKEKIIVNYGIPADNILVAGAGFDDTLFYPAGKTPERPVELVYAGKLSRSKGVPWMLKALAGIDLPWKLHLVGGGSGAEKEECLESASNMSERVIAYGPLPQSELARIMRRSHIFILPSFYEGLPLSLLEALACGCRAVVTGLPGVLEIMGDSETEYISTVEPPRLEEVDRPVKCDEKPFVERLRSALSRHIETVVMNPAVDMEKLRTIVKVYTWEGVYDKIERVYRSLVKGTSDDDR